MNNIEQQHHPTNTHLCKVKFLRGGKKKIFFSFGRFIRTFHLNYFFAFDMANSRTKADARHRVNVYIYKYNKYQYRYK